MHRSRLCQAAILAAALTASGALAQNYPTHPITLVVPYSAGGSVDLVARVVAPKLGERLGQTIVVDNAPGASGTIGTAKVVRAAPDGYTLLMGSGSEISIAKLTNPNVKYDTVIAYDSGNPVCTPYDDCVLVMPSLRQLRPGVTVVRLGRLSG